MKKTFALALAGVLACHHARAVSAPDATPIDPPQRGTVDAARAVPADDRLAIYTVIVRTFFRPSGGQARWVDPRPLGDVRDARADSLAAANVQWAHALREAIGHDRVCVLDEDAGDDGCKGRRGSLLRFSAPYAEADGTVRVFTAVVPVFTPGDPIDTPFEMAFTMERRGRGWHIAESRTVHTRMSSR